MFAKLRLINLQQALGATGGLVLAASRFICSKADCRTSSPASWNIGNLLSNLVGTGQSCRHNIRALRSIMGGRFNQNRQEDAHEFLTALVEKCESERNESMDESICAY